MRPRALRERIQTHGQGIKEVPLDLVDQKSSWYSYWFALGVLPVLDKRPGCPLCMVTGDQQFIMVYHVKINRAEY